MVAPVPAYTMAVIDTVAAIGELMGFKRIHPPVSIAMTFSGRAGAAGTGQHHLVRPEHPS